MGVNSFRELRNQADACKYKLFFLSRHGHNFIKLMVET
jgi:hypothetical protein